MKERFANFCKKFDIHKPTKAFWLKTAAFVGILCLLAVISVFSVSLSMKGRVGGLIVTDPEGEYDCILVLGAKVSNGTPSHMLEDRLKRAVELYKSGEAKKLIVSGDGETPDYDEVEVMKRFALESGVEEADIIVDRYGLSTYDSVWRAKNVYGMKNIVIVTQEYHLVRAVYIAEKLGLNSVGVSSDLRGYAGQIWRDLREQLARFKDFYLIQVEHLPEYTE